MTPPEERPGAEPTEAELAAVRARLGALPPISMPPEVAARLDAALAAEAGRPASGVRRSLRPALAAAAAAAVVVGGGAVFLQGGGPGGARDSQTAAELAAKGQASTGGDLAAARDGDGPASVPARVRALLGTRDGSAPAVAGAPGVSPAPASAVPPGCLRALGIAAGRLRAAAETTYEGVPVLLLVVARSPDAVDVRIVGRSCGPGAPDLRFRDAVRLR